ncbi:MAG: Rpn family recombination-promoting nuclease/putative transposase [Microscillaceae bacterium]|jgi:predicted transposase YdaD|nr:Rpn family recombination-promoting nuclease/putative transposase [Microscillaceae bacterium]
MQISRDTLWKGIIEDLFADFLFYFYPDWANNEVDFEQKFEFLDKELDEIYANSGFKKRYADKLVKVHLKNGQNQWILIHIEVQGYVDLAFPARMFTYFYRIRDRWQKEVMALAILTDEKPDFQPNKYVYQYQDTYLEYHFGTFKLLQKTEDELDITQNPFSVVMLTAQKALQKKNLSDRKILDWKVSLVRKLYAEGYESDKIRKILNFIRYYVRFKEVATSIDFEKNIESITKNRKNMGIEEAILQEVTEKAEKKGIEKGIEKGKLTEKILGIQKALKQGILSEAEIADLFEVKLDFVFQIKNGEIK